VRLFDAGSITRTFICTMFCVNAASTMHYVRSFTVSHEAHVFASKGASHYGDSTNNGCHAQEVDTDRLMKPPCVLNKFHAKLCIASRHWRLPHFRIKFLVVNNDNMTVVRKSKMIVTVLRNLTFICLTAGG
jgi:hypothetical protein